MTLPQLVQNLVFYAGFLVIINFVALKLFPLPEQLRISHPVALLVNSNKSHVTWMGVKIISTITLAIVEVVLFMMLILAIMIITVAYLRLPLLAIVNLLIIGIAIGVTWLHDISGQRRWTTRKRLLVYPVVLALSAGWLVIPCWITYSLAAMVPIYVMIAMTKPLPFKHLAIILAAVFLYDAISVWGTGWMFVLADHISTQHSPLIVKAPANLLAANSRSLSMLGSGDLAFSSLGFASAYSHGLSVYVVWAFVFGLAVAFTLVIITGRGVPAMVPLSPFILGFILFGSRQTGAKLQ